MATLQAYCGLDCGTCDAWLASRNNDPAALEATARVWTARYGKCAS